MDEVSLENGVNYTIGNFSLTIQNLNNLDEGNYTCVIENNNNNEAHTIFLSTYSHITGGFPRATDNTSKFSLDERSTTTEGEDIITTSKVNIVNT